MYYNIIALLWVGEVDNIVIYYSLFEEDGRIKELIFTFVTIT